MHIALKLAGLAAAVSLTACSSLNPFASKPVVKNPPSALVSFDSSVTAKTVWTTSIGQAGSYAFTPAYAVGNVYVAAADGSVAQIDAANGQVRWRVNAGPLTGGVGSDGQTVAVAGHKGSVIALDADGKMRWKMQASSEILSAPAVGKGLVVVRSLDNHIMAFDADTGTRRWSVKRTAPALTLRSAPGIVMAGSQVIVALPGGRLLALEAATGAARWEAVVGDPRGATELERIADISGAPFVSGSDVCAVAYQGRIGCFDIASGTARWAKNFSSNVGAGADERFVFAVDERSNVNAFTRSSGQSVWRNDKLANRRLSMPISFGRAVATGDYQGYIHFLSREDGALIGRVGTDGSPIVSDPLVAGPYLVFQTQSGTVVALAIE